MKKNGRHVQFKNNWKFNKEKLPSTLKMVLKVTGGSYKCWPSAPQWWLFNKFKHWPHNIKYCEVNDWSPSRWYCRWFKSRELRGHMLGVKKILFSTSLPWTTPTIQSLIKYLPSRCKCWHWPWNPAETNMIGGCGSHCLWPTDTIIDDVNLVHITMGTFVGSA